MVEFTLLRLLAVVAIVLGNAFFVAAEFALVSVRETRVQQLIAARRAGARTVLRLQEHLDEFLPAVQLGVTLASLALGWIGEPAVAAILQEAFGRVPGLSFYAHTVATLVGFALITYFHVILGELVPKSLALERAEQLALAVAGPMDIFIALTRPLVRFMNRSANLVLRGFGSRLVREGGVHSPEELKLVVTASRRMGVLPPFQESLIHRSIEVGDLAVREIMVPRQRIVSLPADMPVEEASARIVEEQHSRVPVYDPQRGPDHIIGLVYSKDIARLMHFRLTAQMRFSRAPFSDLRLRQVMRDILVVPETKPVVDLLDEFRRRRRHLAIVVDEFGSTAGLVTVEDVLEQIVGELEDEFDVAAQPPLSLASGAVVLDGSVNLRDLETQLRMHLPREGGVETLAGFLLARLGRIPAGGETVEHEGRRFTVLEMKGRRISRVRVEALPEGTDARPAVARPADAK